jgi:L-iditol 2-dehydrogenase
MKTYQTKAFVYHGSPGEVSRETLPIEAGPTDLVIEVDMCARCGTDKTIYRLGHTSVDPYAPVVLGHELVGRIVYVGKDVGTLKTGIGYREGKQLSDEYLGFTLGERVTFQSRIARYRNGLMLIPKPLANLSFQINGGFSHYMRVPETLIQSGSVLRVPDSVSDEEACLVEPAACVLESIYATPHQVSVDAHGRHEFRAGILPGGNVCIIGSGTLSIIYARLAILEGAGRVVMLARSQAKATLLTEKLGSRVEIHRVPCVTENASEETRTAEKTIVSELLDLTDGYLFDDVVAACNSPAAQRLMLELYTPEGYAVGACFGGTHRVTDTANVDNSHYRAAKTMGTSGCSTKCMEKILDMLAEDALDLSGLTSPRKFTLQDDPHEYFTTDAGGLKPVLYPTEAGS